MGARALAVAWLSAVLLALVAVSCGGDGGGGGGPTDPSTGTFFTPSGGADANAVGLTQTSSTSSTTTLVLRVDARQISGLYGVAFDLGFPDSLLAFEGAAEGVALTTGGVQTSLQVAELESGRLVVGVSRLGDVGGVDADGALLELTFRVTGAGDGALTFSRRSAFDGTGAEIDSVTWSGGTLRVVR